MIKVHRVETYLSPKNASRLSGLSPRRLERLVKYGHLSYYRTPGRHRRYALSELQALRKSS